MTHLRAGRSSPRLRLDATPLARHRAELLRLGGADVAISYMELLDNNVGARGALALGRSLSFGANQSLATLRLDYNATLGAEGVTALCLGLRTNGTLKQLHLPYCAIGPPGGAPLAEMLSYSKLALTTLNLQGNPLGGEGVGQLAPGLARSPALVSVSLADVGLGGAADDVAALGALGRALVGSATLAHVDLLHNRVGAPGGAALQAAFGGDGAAAPTKVRQLLVDATMPQQMFDALSRIEAAGGKGKKGKKGKKK